MNQDFDIERIKRDILGGDSSKYHPASTGLQSSPSFYPATQGYTASPVSRVQNSYPQGEYLTSSKIP
jgi:hypothetical protein